MIGGSFVDFSETFTWNEGGDNPGYNAGAHEVVDVLAGHLVVQRLDHLNTTYNHHIAYGIYLTTFSKSSTTDFMLP